MPKKVFKTFLGSRFCLKKKCVGRAMHRRSDATGTKICRCSIEKSKKIVSVFRNRTLRLSKGAHSGRQFVVSRRHFGRSSLVFLPSEYCNAKIMRFDRRICRQNASKNRVLRCFGSPLSTSFNEDCDGETRVMDNRKQVNCL